MHVPAFKTIRGTVAAFGLLAATFMLATPAQAQGISATECAAQTAPTSAIPGPIASNGDALLTSDGTGFFAEAITSMAVRSASNRHETMTATTDAVAQELTDFYFGTSVEVVVDPPGKTTRAVIIDGDVAVPNQPTVFTIGGVQTLYLHWTTAEQDIAELLDTPAFESFSSDAAPVANCTARAARETSGSLAADSSASDSPATDSSASDSPASDSPATDIPASDSPASDSSATDIPASDIPARDSDPGDLLAYVDDHSTHPSPRVGLPITPLADTAPTESWPLPVVGAALLVTAGGVVLHRRDKIWADRYAANTAPAETLIEASKPSLPVADLPPGTPRVIFLDDANPATTEPTALGAPAANRQIDLHARRDESQLTRLVEKVSNSTSGPVLSRDEFARHVNTEWSRHQNGGKDGAVASLVLSELDAVRLRLGNHAAAELFDQVADHVATAGRPLDRIGLAGDNELAVLMPDMSEAGARAALDDVAKKIASIRFKVGDERVLLTPASGYAMLSDTSSAPDLIRAVESARALSMLNLHLDPERWDPTSVPLHSAGARPSTWANVKAKLRTPVQILLTMVLAWVVPFVAYVSLDAIGLDISYVMYIFLVAALVLTGAFILAEGCMALKQKEPPEVPSKPYPKASAIIAAYMPNEAATVIETIDSFLAMDYPNELQIILAYNTPDPLPVEEHLDRIAAEHPNFVPVRIVGSNSKAQNVNAVLSMADGEFIGMFDADHQPRPDAFTRAWQWIDDGYDVVQGHCLTRNGDACWLAKMIAVEFESIYAVAHPGRAKMHRFGVFGGSNGFWRTELLHETRMRGSMLTEDIDSSMRVVERGFKIRSDRDLVSRELATTTFKQIWNQRMRWAQGWFQVSIEHMKLAFRSKELGTRQKLGIFHLLMWRELYPWLSQQLFPLVAFWALRADGFGNLDWTIPIFLATSIFTFSVGPLQTGFAYKLADQEIKQHKKWFWGYLFFNMLFYTEYKNLIARVAHVKQFMGESDWRVTPRS